MKKNAISGLVLFLLVTLLLSHINLTAQVVINEVHPKPTGGTATPPNGLIYSGSKEYIELYNKGCSSIDVSGYFLATKQTVLSTNTGGTFKIPASPVNVIPPGGHLVLGPASASNSVSIDVVMTSSNACIYNGNFVLANIDGWLALYDASGNPVDAIYWSSAAANISQTADYAGVPCVPVGSPSGVSLLSAQQINTSFPSLIAYVGNTPTAGLTISRIPDGGAWQNNQAQSIDDLTTGNCNGGTCVSVSSFSITANVINPTCGSSNGSATITPNPSGTYTYTWSSPASSTTNIGNGLSAGNYTVTVGQSGCTTSTVISLTASGSPTISSVASSPATCGSSNGSATVTAAPSGLTYTWMPSGGSNASASGLSAGTYTVIAGLASCLSSTVITVTSTGSPTITGVQTLTTVCGGSTGSATVNALPSGVTYTWSGGVSSTTNTASGLQAGTYSVTVGLGSCTTSTVITVMSGGSPTITGVQTLTTVCGGSTGSATVNALPSGVTYTWSGGVSSTTNTASGLQAGTYSVTVGLGSCTTNTLITINSAGGPAITSVQVSGEHCQSSDGSATVTAVPSGVSYTWSPAVSSSNVANGLASGVYNVTVGLGACQTSTVVTIQPVVVNFTISPDVTIIKGSSTGLSVSSGFTYTWSPSSTLSCSDCPGPIASPDQTTTYCVEATDGICTYSNCVTVYVDTPCVVLKNYTAPNAFSPNDDGSNDEFSIKGFDKCSTSFFIQIFNRWGELIFSSTDPSFVWDGKYQGRVLDPAVFVYYLKATFVDGSEFFKKGNITLLH